MGRPRKKVVVFIVEGQSDANALGLVIPKLYDQYVDEDILVEFAKMKDVDQDGGDITAKHGVHPENIEDMITKLILKPFFAETAIYPKDVLEIVQLVDTDGAYIPDECISVNPESADRPVYHDDCILTDNVEHIQVRNKEKRENLNHLVGLDTIKARSKSVPYSVYYFSSNLDHYINDDANLSPAEKCRRASDYSYSAAADINYFIDSITHDPVAAIGMSYEESWNFIREGTHSLEKHTNINILIERLLNKNI